MSHFIGSPTHVMRPNGAFYRFIGKGLVERCKPDEARNGILIQVGSKTRVLQSCRSRTRGRVGIVTIINFEDFGDSTKDPKPIPMIELGVECGNSHEAIWYHAHELEVSK